MLNTLKVLVSSTTRFSKSEIIATGLSLLTNTLQKEKGCKVYLSRLA
jgi:hypothetical protein